MKQFLLNVCSTVVGVTITLFAIFSIGILGMFSFIALKNASASLKDGSVLCIKLSGQVVERSSDDVFSAVLGESEPVVDLSQVRSALKAAYDSKQIKGVILEAGMLMGEPASLEELRSMIENFQKSQKPVVAYGDYYTQGAYYVCSSADKIILSKGGAIAWRGLSAETMYLKETLAKVGVGMQVFKVGRYKSAVEPFTEKEMSSAAREQTQSYVSGIWKSIRSAVAFSRNIPADSLNAYADRCMALAPSEDFLATGMVDRVLYKDEAKAYMKKLFGKNYETISPDELSVAEKKSIKKNKIAVYYAYGDVVSSVAESMSEESTLSAEQMVGELEKLEKDDEVKAVVIRINSGGGSAYASEQIWRAVKKLKSRKPVVVSMGGMAASGAYYISSAANLIFAQSTTLTGSIGIFGMYPDASKLLTEKMGLGFSTVKTNAFADFGTLSRPMNGDERDMVQRYVDRGYGEFVQRVAEGRKMNYPEVEQIAQGRVWTGEQAVRNGLVDKIGGLKNAIREAHRMAGIKSLSECRIEEYPAKRAWWESIVEKEKNDYFSSEMQQFLGEYYSQVMTLVNVEKQDRIQARLPYYITIK